jgi:hypothetical protein
LETRSHLPSQDQIKKKKCSLMFGDNLAVIST